MSWLQYPSTLLHRALTPDAVRERAKAYRLIFRSPSGTFVLNDLAQFCRGFQPTFDPDPHKAALLEGRREVFLRVLQHMELTDAELIAAASGKYPIM